MSLTWNAEETPAPKPVTIWGWVRIAYRGPVLVFVIAFGVVLTLLLRVFEKPLFAPKRPITPFITQIVCRLFLLICGIRYRTKGEIMKGQGAVVSNHVSWFDIFSLNAATRIYFVSKAEVSNWPGINILAFVTGTVFINRNSREAKVQKELFERRLGAGHKLLFFPEGTSTDGLRVLPFKSTLFAAFFTDGLRETMRVQPVTLVYEAPKGESPRFYGWWGDMAFGPNLMQMLAQRGHGRITLVRHAPVKVSDFPDRKALAKHCENAVRSGLPPEFAALTDDEF